MSGEVASLFKPDEATRILSELLAVLSRHVKLEYKELRVEAKEECDIRAIDVVPGLRGLRVRRLFERPEKGSVSKVIGAKVDRDAVIFLFSLEKMLRSAGVTVTTSDLVRLGLAFVTAYLVGDKSTIEGVRQELSYMRARFNRWLNRIYKGGNDAPEARFNPVKPGSTQFNQDSLTNRLTDGISGHGSSSGNSDRIKDISLTDDDKKLVQEGIEAVRSGDCERAREVLEVLRRRAEQPTCPPIIANWLIPQLEAKMKRRCL